MPVSLRWPAKKWEKAPFMCRWFGHIWESGWWGDIPYLKPYGLPGTQDGIGRRHVDLTCECDRCGSKRIVAHVHNWEKRDD